MERWDGEEQIASVQNSFAVSILQLVFFLLSKQIKLMLSANWHIWLP